MQTQRYSPNTYNHSQGGWEQYFIGTPITKWLILINVGVFLLTVLFGGAGTSLLNQWGMFNIEKGLYGLQVWRLISFQFLHGSMGHLFVNMLGLFFFGRIMERWWGSHAFLGFYLLCGVGGALFYSFLVQCSQFLPYDGVGANLLGASAGVFGVLIGVTLLNPEGVVYVFFVLPMKLRTFALLFLSYESYNIIVNGSNAGGSAGHLGGVIVGVILMKNEMWFRDFMRKGEQFIQKQPQLKPQAKTRSPSLRPSSSLDLDVGDEEVNEILDKINREGFQSLSEEEKQVLEKKVRKPRLEQ